MRNAYPSLMAHFTVYLIVINLATILCVLKPASKTEAAPAKLGEW